jgi:hypothetical protein
VAIGSPTYNRLVRERIIIPISNVQVETANQEEGRYEPMFDSQGRLMTQTTQPMNSLVEEPLHKLSYETLIKQLYNIPAANAVPDFLIVNGVKVNFISFQQISQKLSRNEIERYIIEPLLQPYAGNPSSLNRILTMFDKNGMTYLVKAQYNPTTNQISPPV